MGLVEGAQQQSESTSAQLLMNTQALGRLQKEQDFLTTYQAEFSQTQKVMADKMRSQAMRSGEVPGGLPTKTSDSYIEAGNKKHDKNRSNLYYLLESQTIPGFPAQADQPRLDPPTPELEPSFGTYHWKRCEVTKTAHPGLCYR